MVVNAQNMPAATFTMLGLSQMRINSMGKAEHLLEDEEQRI
jgi:hypothetical protein